MRELIIIRTHFYNDAIDQFFSYISRTSGRDVAIICDETNGPVDLGSGKETISLTEEFVRSMNLHIPGRFGWLCGDYFLYAAARRFPNYNRYWMVESDVRFSLPESRTFFDLFQSDPADVFAFHIYKAKSTWYWYTPMSYFLPNVYACLFPVIGISKRAVDAAYDERVTMSGTFNSVVPVEEKRRWPNDESFILSTLAAQGFDYRSLNAGERRFSSPATFGVGLPKSHERIARQTPDGMIYHPVHSKTGFVNKANTWLTSHINRKTPVEKLGQLFTQDFLDDLRLEATNDEFEAFSAKLRPLLKPAAL